MYEWNSQQEIILKHKAEYERLIEQSPSVPIEIIRYLDDLYRK